MANKEDGIKLPPGFDAPKPPLARTLTQSSTARKNRRKRLKDHSIWHVKTLIFGLILACACIIATPYVLNQQRLDTLFQGEKHVVTETCTVTDINFSELFDTTCGKIRWNTDYGTDPSNVLQKGSTYTFTTVGYRSSYLNSYPRLSEPPKAQ